MQMKIMEKDVAEINEEAEAQVRSGNANTSFINLKKVKNLDLSPLLSNKNGIYFSLK